MVTTPVDFDARVNAHVVAVADTLSARLAEMTSGMRDYLASQISELDGDDALVELMGASIAGNLDNIVHSLRHNIPVDRAEPPSAAFEYARRLAQRGVPVSALVRAYRLGQKYLLRVTYPATMASGAPEVDAAAYDEIVQRTFDYIDWISQRVVGVYETERDAWLADRNSQRVARVHEILAGETEPGSDTEAVIGYRLRRQHLGVVMWIEEQGTPPGDLAIRFGRVARALSEQVGLGAEPLVIAQDRVCSWAWIPVPDGFAVDDRVRLVAAQWDGSVPRPLIALGSAHRGVAGFRTSHQEALRAYRVARLRDPDDRDPVTGYDSGLGVAALLAADLAETRQWVRATLGDLGRDDAQHRRLRDTLMTFLRNGGSYTATAEAMLMHRNSVRYRITIAERALGRRISSDRQAIELALTACHWLGRAVLAPAGDG